MRVLRARVAALLVVSLIAAPLPAWLQDTCDHCPPDCPMHAQGRLHCHGAADTRAGSGASRGMGCAGIGRPGCHHGSQLPSVAAAPAVLSVPAAVAPPAVTLHHHVPRAPLYGRASDPPESPPPILSL